MAGPVLVTDFGTSFSSAAIVVGGDIAVVKETHSGETIPSAVCDVDGELIVGALAVRRRRRAADRYQEGFKRNLGERAPVVLGDTEYRVGDLVAAVLGAVRDEAEKMVHEPVTAGVVTIPATYESARREIMRDAAAKAGLAEVELLEEPIAAAFAPLIGQRPEPGDLVLVG